MSITTFAIISIIKSAAVIFVLLTAVAYSVWLERKVSAHIQNRWGPTRVGPFGLLQPLADGVKFIFKEDLTQPYVYKTLYIASPIIAVVFAISAISVIPFGNSITIGPITTQLQITDLNIGLLVVLGITSMGVYGVALAETNRTPFDLPEAESELVAGYHTEYSAMKFAMFFMAEYSNMVTVACLSTLLFFGGWLGPVFGPPIVQSLLPVLWFCLKVFFFMFLYVWVRWTLPRFRYDQLMAFGWKFLLPMAVANLVVTALVVAWKPDTWLIN